MQVPLADWTIPSAQVIFRSIGAAQRNAAAQQNQQIQEGYHDSAQRKHRTHYRPDRISTQGAIRPKNCHESMHHGRRKQIARISDKRRHSANSRQGIRESMFSVDNK